MCLGRPRRPRAVLRGQAPVIGVQFEYSLVERTADREILPMAEALGLGGALWSPLRGRLLTSKYGTSGEGRLSDWGRIVHTEYTQRKTAVVDRVLAVAKETGAPAAQVAVAWVREFASGAATPLVPVIGPRTLPQLGDYLAALDVQLPGREVVRQTASLAARPLLIEDRVHDPPAGHRTPDHRSPTASPGPASRP